MSNIITRLYRYVKDLFIKEKINKDLTTLAGVIEHDEALLIIDYLKNIEFNDEKCDINTLFSKLTLLRKYVINQDNKIRIVYNNDFDIFLILRNTINNLNSLDNTNKSINLCFSIYNSLVHHYYNVTIEKGMCNEFFYKYLYMYDIKIMKQMLFKLNLNYKNFDKKFSNIYLDNKDYIIGSEIYKTGNFSKLYLVEKIGDKSNDKYILKTYKENFDMINKLKELNIEIKNNTDPYLDIKKNHEIYILNHVNSIFKNKYIVGFKGILNDGILMEKYGEMLDKNKVSDFKDIVNICYQLAYAIYFLHTNNIIHNDIRIKNILINDKNNIKICDFEYARYTTHDSVIDNVLDIDYGYLNDIHDFGRIMYELYTKSDPNDSQKDFTIGIYDKYLKYGNVSIDIKNKYVKLMNRCIDKSITSLEIINYFENILHKFC